MRIESLLRPHISGIKPYTSARHENSSGLLLDANENPFGTYNRYPDPFQSKLKEKLAEIKNVKAERLFIGNGSDEIIDLLIRLFCEPGEDKVLTFTPTYGIYKVSAAINAVETVEIPLTADFDIPADFPTDESLKVAFICSPNNPTGNTIPKKSIERLLDRFQGMVVIDEAYIDFSPEESWAMVRNPNLVVIQTLSKAWGLAGLRLGLAIADPLLIGYLNKIKPPYNISSANQIEALKALSNTHDYEQNIKRILEERASLKKALLSFKVVRKVYPSQANFLLVEFENSEEVFAFLHKEGIVVRNRASEVQNCLRITIGSPTENQNLIKTLKRLENEKSIVSG
jgi:histidinol-phosphate aminotransferase